MNTLVDFLYDDVGAVTVDFLAIVAASLLMGIILVYSIFNVGVASLAAGISSTLSGVSMPVSDDVAIAMSGQDSEGEDNDDEGDDGEGDDGESDDGDGDGEDDHGDDDGEGDHGDDDGESDDGDGGGNEHNENQS